jgi:hypothetical protein
MLLVPGFWLALASTAVPADPDGAFDSIDVLGTSDASTPALSFQAWKHRIDVVCGACTPANPAVVAMAWGAASHTKEEFRVGAVGAKSEDQIQVLGPISAADSDKTGLYVLAVRVSGSAGFSFAARNTSFIESAGPLTKAAFPLIRVGQRWMVDALQEARFGAWRIPASLDAYSTVGSAAGPAAQWEGDFRIQFASPEPESIDTFFVSWQTPAAAMRSAPRLTVSSPRQESVQQLRVIFAGALVGAVALPAVQIGADLARRISWVATSFRQLSRRHRALRAELERHSSDT